MFERLKGSMFHPFLCKQRVYSFEIDVDVVKKHGFSIRLWTTYGLRLNRLSCGEAVFLAAPRCLCVGISASKFAKFQFEAVPYPFNPKVPQEVTMAGTKILIRRGTEEEFKDYISKNPLASGELAFTYDKPVLYIGISESQFAKIEGTVEEY